ncbi:MAG: hypothetical protein P8P56_08045 [Yoonia sp.]|nr:hypothetical protein [Yoonia sp.]MDG1861964.1 hypothetical protein [Yoonia sp.]
MSDLILLAVGATALFVIYLVRVLWGRGRAAPKNTPANDAIIVDGSNVMHWGGEPSVKVLRGVIRAVTAKGFAPYVIFDANVGYKLEGRYLDDVPMALLIGVPARSVLVVEKGVSADERILEVATERGLRVVSNDRFRDWSVTYPIVRQKGRILRGDWKGGNVVWRSK